MTLLSTFGQCATHALEPPPHCWQACGLLVRPGPCKSCDVCCCVVVRLRFTWHAACGQAHLLQRGAHQNKVFQKGLQGVCKGLSLGMLVCKRHLANAAWCAAGVYEAPEEVYHFYQVVASTA